MLHLTLGVDSDRPLRVLCLGAHCDDLEIGCGGTIAGLIRRYPRIEVYWTVFAAADQRRRDEALASAEGLLADAAEKTVVTKSFQDAFFPYEGRAVKESFQEIRGAFEPDVVFTHSRHDLHQDHRLLAELTWNTFRDHLILEYEIPKYDGDLGRPNLFVPLDRQAVDQKLLHLQTHFPTQRAKSWFTDETFRGLLRLRGVEAAADEGYAEAFHCRKLCWR